MQLDTIVKDLIQILTDMTQDWDNEFSGGITSDTRLIADLGLESIDVVMLIGEIHRHYNRRNLPFERVLLRDGRYVDDIQVSSLAAFLHEQLAFKD